MTTFNYENEMLKKRYFVYLRDIKGFSENSVRAFENSLQYWQRFTDQKPFKNLNKKDSSEFKGWLKGIKNKKTDEPLSLTYLYHILRRVRAFFEWLIMQPGYRRINPTVVESLRLSNKDTRIAIQANKKKFPTMKSILKTIECINPVTEVDLRDRALICLTLLTGGRISAIISLPMQSFDLNDFTIDQNPKFGVKTKYAKHIETTLFPLEDERPLQYFIAWFKYLRDEKGFKMNDPLFPMSEIQNGDVNISYYNTGRVIPKFWATTNSARKIFKKRAHNAEVPYYHPHAFRHLIVNQFARTSLTEEEKRAVSQNLGHANVGTTFGSYGHGEISGNRQVEIIKNIKIGGNNISGKFSLDPSDLSTIVNAITNNIREK